MRKTLRKKLFKSVLWFSLFVFLPFAFGFDAYAQAKDLKEEVQSKKISVILNSIKDKDFDEILNKSEEILEKDFSDDLRKDAFRTILGQLKERDKKIRENFAQTEKTLKEKNLPPEILKRHKEFVEKYEERFKKFEGKVNSYTNSNWLSRSFSRNGLKGFIEENTYKREIPEFDPDKLPHRSKPVKKIQTEEYKPEKREKPKKMEKQGAIQQGSSDLIEDCKLEIENFKFEEDKISPNNSDSNSYTLYPQNHTLTDELFAYAGDISMLPLLVSQSGNGYLQETMEVQFTSEIDSLATALEHDPIKIYEYVRNRFKYEPYYGSLKGSQETFYEKAGNDFDLASLLISLLRTSEIKSRYVYGEIIVPIDKAMGWLGVLDPWVAGNIFATMGVPARMLVVDGKPYGLRMEHCWVEAQLNYDIDLGRRNPVSKDTTWIPIDPSYKILEYNDPVKLEEEVPLNVDSLMQEIHASATIDSVTGAITGMDTTIINQALESYGTRTNDWIDENLGDSATVGEIFPFTWIKTRLSDGFSPVLPYQVTRNIDKYSEISEDLRYKLTIEVMIERNIGTDISYTLPTVGIVGKRILLAYAPASSNDKELLLSQLPDSLTDTTDIPSLISAYLIHMKPQIVIENEAVATGSAIGMGKEQFYKIIFHSPAGFIDDDEIENSATVGAMYGIGFDLSRIPTEVIKKRLKKYQETKEQIESQNITLLTSYDILGELFNLVSLSYYYQLDIYNELFSRKMEVFHQRVPSSAIISHSIRVTSILGLPYAISINGIKMDVDRDMEAVFGKDGENNRKKSYNIESGIMSSEMEARVLDQLFNIEKDRRALCATRILSIANERQIPIYTINSSNISQILPLLQTSDKVKSSIECAVNSGMEVIVPGSNIEYNGWEGIGYIVLNPETGEGAYMIEGIGGGWLAWTKAILQILLMVVLIVAAAILLAPAIAGFITAFVGAIIAAITSIISVIIYFDSFTKGAEQVMAIIQMLLEELAIAWPAIQYYLITYGPVISQLIMDIVPGSPPPSDYPHNLVWVVGESIRKWLDSFRED